MESFDEVLHFVKELVPDAQLSYTGNRQAMQKLKKNLTRLRALIKQIEGETKVRTKEQKRKLKPAPSIEPAEQPLEAKNVASPPPLPFPLPLSAASSRRTEFAIEEEAAIEAASQWADEERPSKLAKIETGESSP